MSKLGSTMSSCSEQHNGISSGDSSSAVAVNSTVDKSGIKKVLLVSTKLFQKKFAQFRQQVSSEQFSSGDQLCTFIKDLRMDLLDMEKEVIELKVQKPLNSESLKILNRESFLNNIETDSDCSSVIQEIRQMSSARNTPDKPPSSPDVNIKRNIFTGSITTQTFGQKYPEPQCNSKTVKSTRKSCVNNREISFTPLDQDQYTLKERISDIENYLVNIHSTPFNDMQALSNEFARMQMAVQNISSEVLPGSQQYKPVALFSL